MKTLIVVHRLLREGDPTFKEEFLAYSYKGSVLQIANFKDDSSQLGDSLSCIVINATESHVYIFFPNQTLIGG